MQSTALVTWTDPTATDNSGRNVTITCSVNSKSHFEIGQTDVFCEAQDPYGNNSTCIFTIDVQGINVQQ